MVDRHGITGTCERKGWRVVTSTQLTKDTGYTEWTDTELMTISAARALEFVTSCFVGVGIPSTAAITAQRILNPDLILIYESGTIGSRPDKIPLSIGDGALCDSAISTVSVPEMFNYWLQPGRIDTGLLGAAQVDRFGNLNSTVIGDEYRLPKVRLPGAGGAPEIASSCEEVTVIIKHSRKAFPEKVDFITSVGHGRDMSVRGALGFAGQGPVRVITDLGILEMSEEHGELILAAIHPGVTVETIAQATGWDLIISPNLVVTPEPTQIELDTLRQLIMYSSTR